MAGCARSCRWRALGSQDWRTVEGPSRTLSAVSNLPSAISTVGAEEHLASHSRRTARGFVQAWRRRGRGRIHRRNLRSRKKGGDCVGKCRAGKATKVMALADSDGLPLSVVVAEGNRHDIVLTDRTLDAAFVDRLPPRLIGDEAWDSAALQQRLADERNVELIAPKRGGKRPSRRRQDGRALRRYKRRWKVEALFAALEQMRRLATRWERKAANFLALVQLGCVVVLLRARC